MRVTGVSKREFRAKLVDFCGGCALHDRGWPCGTCFRALFPADADRVAVLTFAYRGFECSDYSEVELRERIRQLWTFLKGQQMSDPPRPVYTSRNLTRALRDK